VLSSVDPEVIMHATTSSTITSPGASTDRYVAPGWATRRLMNPLMAGLVKIGLPIKGAGLLSVRGRSTGEWRTVPVNPLTLDGELYLVAPRGNTQWVRNLRVAGSARLSRRRAVLEFDAVELDDAAKPPILRAYLKAWAFEVGAFFDGVGAGSTDAELAAIAAKHPIFRVVTS
jgi:deazaflavin-dependent oxidoreductase (nitroreductase family)